MSCPYQLACSPGWNLLAVLDFRRNEEGDCEIVIYYIKVQPSEVQAGSNDVSNPSNSYGGIFSLDNIPLALTITNMPNTAYSTSSMTYCAATRALRISSTEIQTYWSQVQGEPARSAVKTKGLQEHCCYYHLPANSYFTCPQMKSEDEKRR